MLRQLVETIRSGATKQIKIKANVIKLLTEKNIMMIT